MVYILSYTYSILMSLECSQYEFRCNDGQCIDDRFVCNRNIDCRDGSDEYNCPGVSNSPIILFILLCIFLLLKYISC